MPGTTERNLCPHILRSAFPYRAGLQQKPLLAPLAGPVLEPKAVTCYFPHRVAWWSLGCQDEVLVKVSLFVAFKFHCSTDHNKNCGLAWGGFIMDRLAVYHVDLELTGRQHFKKLTQGLLSRNSVSIPHQGGCAHVQAGQQSPPLIHGGVVHIHKLLSSSAGLIHVGLEVHWCHLWPWWRRPRCSCAWGSGGCGAGRLKRTRVNAQFRSAPTME